jgi:hypothetical protein
MPRRAHGPRLWLEKAQRDADGNLTHHARWCIKDRGRKHSTGCSENDRRGAEKALAAYIAEKHVAGAASGVRSPAAIPLADVVALYARHIADRHARPRETSARLDRLLNFFGDKMLGDMNGELCRAYVRERGRQFAARRELEELRAAINYHHSEGLCQAIVAVVLPPKSEPRGRWLSRGEAARLIWSAWRYREIQKGHPTGRRARAHVARFLIAALYTARRKDALLAAALKPAEGWPWIDLDRGVFYGRPSARRSKKRQPPIRIPTRLLAHLRRWRKNGQAYLIEFNGAPIGSIDKAFAANVDAVGLDADVVVHTTRHTAITWLAMGGVDPYEVCRFAGITMEVFEDVYAHHHPDFMRGVERGYGAYRDRYRDRNDATEHEQTAANVAKIADYSKAAR